MELKNWNIRHYDERQWWLWRNSIIGLNSETSQFLLLNLVHNRKLMLNAPTLHCAQPFCIAPCLVHLFCSLAVKNLSCTWAWWWLTARKIFVNKGAQITRQDGVPLKLSQKVIRQLKWKNEPGTWDTTQTLYVRLKVTIFLHLRPNRMTRSISPRS